MALETGARSGHSAATFRAWRPSHICETPRCRDVERYPYVSSWRLDWLADDAVSCEPVSAPNSLLTGKLTVNFAKSGPPSRFLCLIIARVQELTVEFPTQRNREFRVSGNVFRGTGNFNRGSSETGQPQTLGGAASKLVHFLPPRSDVRFRGQSGHC